MRKLPLSLIFAGALGLMSCQQGKTSAADAAGDGAAAAETAVEVGNRVGQKFVDFEAEYDGKTTRFSDYVGKGKYVLVDFWASWCGPCRMEVPGLIDVYNEYGGDNFTVLGVATWDEPEKTLEAAAELGITYPQMLNAQTAGSVAYDFESIPQIMLFDPDGILLARDLRGEGIAAAVRAALGKE